MDKTAMYKKKTKLQNWSEIELERQASGLTVKQWCRRENMNPSTYYSHLRKIRENLSEQIPVPVTTLTENTQTESAAIRIEWGDNNRVKTES